MEITVRVGFLKRLQAKKDCLEMRRKRECFSDVTRATNLPSIYFLQVLWLSRSQAAWSYQQRVSHSSSEIFTVVDCGSLIRHLYDYPGTRAVSALVTLTGGKLTCHGYTKDQYHRQRKMVHLLNSCKSPRRDGKCYRLTGRRNGLGIKYLNLFRRKTSCNASPNRPSEVKTWHLLQMWWTQSLSQR